MNPIQYKDRTKVIHISRDMPEFYDQIDAEDNLMNEAMITQFVMINADSDQPLKFKKDIEVFQIYGENKFELSNLNSEIIKPEVLHDLI